MRETVLETWQIDSDASHRCRHSQTKKRLINSNRPGWMHC